MSELLNRAVQVLDQLRLAGGDLAIRDIAKQVGLPKSTVQRLLRDLVDTDMAARDPITRRYRLGPRTLALGMAYQHGINLRNVALPVMTRLRDETGETVGLSVEVGEELMHVEQVESASQLRRTFEIGHPLPLWCGAPSRLFLAFRSDEDIQRIIADRGHTDVEPANPPSPERMAAEVRQARIDGYAMAFDETVASVSTLSAPVIGPAGHVVATLSVTGPTSRFTRKAMNQSLPALTASADLVSGQLGAPTARHAVGQP